MTGSPLEACKAGISATASRIQQTDLGFTVVLYTSGSQQLLSTADVAVVAKNGTVVSVVNCDLPEGRMLLKTQYGFEPSK